MSMLAVQCLMLGFKTKNRTWSGGSCRRKNGIESCLVSLKAQDVLAGLQNLGYSAAAGIGGMVAGAAAGTAIAPGPGTAAGIVGGIIGAGVVSAPVMYRATKDQFLSSVLDKMKAEDPTLSEEKMVGEPKNYWNPTRRCMPCGRRRRK